VLGERFHHSPEALTVQSFQGTEALAALVAPTPVAPVLYKRKGEMRKPDKHFSCYSCGTVTECSPGATPCEALQGWLTVSSWEGPGVVEHYHFCSFSCLESWADAQVPKVPEVFLDSFKEDKSK
jgi:hypothetical protein